MSWRTFRGWSMLAIVVMIQGYVSASVDVTGDGRCDVVRVQDGVVSVRKFGTNEMYWSHSLYESAGVPRDPILVLDGPQRKLLVITVQSENGHDLLYGYDGATGQVA